MRERIIYNTNRYRRHSRPASYYYPRYYDEYPYPHHETYAGGNDNQEADDWRYEGYSEDRYGDYDDYRYTGRYYHKPPTPRWERTTFEDVLGWDNG